MISTVTDHCISFKHFEFLLACDGRVVYPHELKLLSDDHYFFVFYAVMMDVRIRDSFFLLDPDLHFSSRREQNDKYFLWIIIIIFDRVIRSFFYFNLIHNIKPYRLLPVLIALEMIERILSIIIINQSRKQPIGTHENVFFDNFSSSVLLVKQPYLQLIMSLPYL